MTYGNILYLDEILRRRNFIKDLQPERPWGLRQHAAACFYGNLISEIVLRNTISLLIPLLHAWTSVYKKSYQNLK